ncbi:MAG: 50S ribosomal protein L4 [Candidatus Geothermarchaeales archaeon]
MEAPVYSIRGRKTGSITLPPLFTLQPRRDLIHRVFVHQQSHAIQPQGRDPLAGRKTSAEYFGTGLGMARIPRIKSQPHRGRGATVAMAVGGRKPHVTTPEKRVYKRINKKERALAIASAIAASADPKIVAERGHLIDEVPHIPLIVTDGLEKISNTRDFMDATKKLGLAPDIERVRGSVKTVGGKASWRGRRVKHRVGPLIVYAKDRGISKASRNVLGVDAVSAEDVSVIHLAPGGLPGRLTVWDRSALRVLEERFKDRVRMVSQSV